MADKYDLRSNNTLDRREMQCPRCFEYRLEPNYDIINEFSGQRDKVLYATRCGNEVCPVDRVDPEDIRKQTPDQNVVQRFAADYGVVATGVVLAFIALAAGFGLMLTGIIGPAAPVDLSVTVYDDTGTGAEGVEVLINGTTSTTGPDGTADLGEIGPKVTKRLDILPNPNSRFAAPPPTEVRVGDGKVWASNPHPDIDAEIRDGTLEITLPTAHNFTRQGFAPDDGIQVPFANAHNAQRGVTVTLYGVSQADSTQVIPIDGRSDTVAVLDDPTAQYVTVTAPVSEYRASETGTYESTTSIAFDGQRQTNGQIHFEDPHGGYPDVELGGTRVCTGEEVARNDGTCSIPETYLDGDAVALSLGARGDSIEYTVEYTAQSVADSVPVTINGETRQVSRPSSAEPGEAWQRRVPIDALVMGENTVEYTTPIVASVETTAEVAVEYELTSGVPKSPTVYVESADGDTHTRAVSNETLDGGVLTGSQTVELNPEWFAEGSNRVWVETENGGRLLFEVSAELVMDPSQME